MALSTLLLNLTIAGCGDADSVGVRCCVDAATRLSETQTDSEAHFRLLVAIGTALCHPGADDDDGDAAQSLDLDNLLHWCVVDGEDKTRQCAQLLTELLAR